MFHYYSRSVNICSNYNYVHFKNFLHLPLYFSSLTHCGCCNVNAFIGCLRMCAYWIGQWGASAHSVCAFIASAPFSIFTCTIYSILEEQDIDRKNCRNVYIELPSISIYRAQNSEWFFIVQCMYQYYICIFVASGTSCGYKLTNTPRQSRSRNTYTTELVNN